MELVRTKTALQFPWKKLYQVLFTIQMTAKLLGFKPWVYVSQSKKAPPDIWSVQPLETSKPTDKEEKQLTSRQIASSQDTRSRLHTLNTKHSFPFFLLFWHWPGNNTIVSISQAIAKGDKLCLSDCWICHQKLPCELEVVTCEYDGD